MNFSLSHVRIRFWTSRLVFASRRSFACVSNWLSSGLDFFRDFSSFTNLSVHCWYSEIKMKNWDDQFVLQRRVFFFSRIQSRRSITAALDKIFYRNCGLVGVSITSDNQKCPKNRKLTEKQWEQPDDVIFLFSQICRIQAKNVGIIPEMMRLIWFWSQISMNATKNEKNWHFL